jgi:DnaJ-class molecular chaperone
MTKTLYQVLGLDPSAEEVVVRAAFKALAQKYHPDKLKPGSVQGANLMVDINLSYKILSNPISRKKYDQALNESLGLNKKSPPPSEPAGKRPQYRPNVKREHAEHQNSGDFNPFGSTGQPSQAAEHEYQKLINRIKANAVDEIELVNLFEKLFKLPLTIRHGYSNTYWFEENEKRYTHDFKSLKEVIVQKLTFELSQMQGQETP